MSKESKHLKTINELMDTNLCPISMKYPKHQQDALMDFQKAHKEKYGGRKIPIAKLIALFLDYAIKKMEDEKQELREGYSGHEFGLGSLWDDRKYANDDSEKDFGIEVTPPYGG